MIYILFLVLLITIFNPCLSYPSSFTKHTSSTKRFSLDYKIIKIHNNERISSLFILQDLKDSDNKDFLPSSSSANGNNNQFLKYFVPAFIAFWAVGYTALAYVETRGGGLGDLGGIIGTGLVVVLMLALFIAAAYETFKP